MADSTLNHEADSRLQRLENFVSRTLHEAGYKRKDDEPATAHIDRAMSGIEKTPDEPIDSEPEHEEGAEA